MKKFLIFFMAVMMNCQVVWAENNLLDYSWWRTATIEDVQKEIANGVDVNANDRDERTVLTQAIHCNASPEIIKMLLDAGAEGKTEYSPDECWGDMEIDMSEHCGGWC